MPSNRTIAAIIAVVLPVALIGLGVMSFIVMGEMRPKPREQDKPPVGLAVFVETVHRENVRLTVTAQGEAAPRRQVNLSPQVSGRITYVSPHLVNGGFVARGQLLTRVEDADYKLAVTRAQSSVASARQGLVRVEAEADIARRELEDLGIEDASPLALKTPQLEEARASLAAAQAQLADAELQLSRTGIYAPFDGLVMEENVDIGQFVSTGSNIGRVFATDVVEVELLLTNDEMARIGLPIAFNASKANPGPVAHLSANVGGITRQWDGKITRTGASVDSGTRLISIFVEVEDPFGAGADGDAPLAPGLFVDALIEGRSVDDVLVAPRAALRGVDNVYIIETVDAAEWRSERESSRASGAIPPAPDLGEEEPNRGGETDEKEAAEETGPVTVLRPRKVQVLHSDSDRVLILSGIDAGDQVVISPVQAAFNGMRVRVIETEADADFAEAQNGAN